MTASEETTNASYNFQTRLKGEVELRLFNDFYLSVKETTLNKTQQFRLELATLNPQAERVEEPASHWLSAAVLGLLACGLSLYAAFSATTPWMPLLGTALTAAMTALFIALYLRNSKRKWIIETRYARYPLLEIPYRKRQRQEVGRFIKTLQHGIEKSVENKGYSPEQLFAGELRMLRRLSEEEVINRLHYEQAKAYMMKHHDEAAGE